MRHKIYYTLALTACLAFGSAACVIVKSPDATPTAPPAAARRPEDEALLRAARNGHAEAVQNLLTAPNANVNAQDENGNTPLIEAARHGHNEVVAALLTARADVRVKNKAGQTALMLASAGGHTQSIQLLKQAGATQ